MYNWLLNKDYSTRFHDECSLINWTNEIRIRKILCDGEPHRHTVLEIDYETDLVAAVIYIDSFELIFGR